KYLRDVQNTMNQNLNLHQQKLQQKSQCGNTDDIESYAKPHPIGVLSEVK
ncbi:7261_t:CDS:1, partial [Funneliformis mosseae]